MATDVQESRDLGVSVADVLATLRDRAHWERRAAIAPEASLRFEGLVVEPDALEARLVGDVPLSWLPSAVRKRVPALPSIRRVERWRVVASDHLAGELLFEIDGVSATVDGSGTVRSVASGSRIAVDLRIAVSVPLVGGLVEQAIAGQVGPSLAKELALLDEARSV
ncbi:hypothetical protein N865_05245 [Intrasporangium oryzae NRRL B-24470]|uniref:DUF2505 domain-containing protein n=1 Tax=Intrasporangium oryzae NRRL B-24470 TaxID=1386089 RepID=W9GCJ6_9MICO|nr:DUF2505 domain-containing protein [Intrasporangium oryzae]EWT02518.1 hypothetical protein N865_05245 [Intrasporangium oryzae NRRL B-24470]